MRAWYNGSTSASQAEDEGSIPFARTKNSADPLWSDLFLACGVGREPDQEGSERSVSEVKGAQQNHQERRDWHDFVWELYIPFARTKNLTGLVPVFIFDFQILSDWHVCEFLPMHFQIQRLLLLGMRFLCLCTMNTGTNLLFVMRRTFSWLLLRWLHVW